MHLEVNAMKNIENCSETYRELYTKYMLGYQILLSLKAMNDRKRSEYQKKFLHIIYSAFKLIPSGHLTFFLSFAWFCNLQSETLYQDNCNHELNLD